MSGDLESRRRRFASALKRDRSGPYRSLLRDDVLETASQLRAAYEGWNAPVCNEGRIEVFAPRLLEFNPNNRRHQIRQRMWEFGLRDIRGSYDMDAFERSVTHICLYVDRLWLPDPLEIIARHCAYWEDRRITLSVHAGLIDNSELACAIAELFDDRIELLVRKGIVALYPAIQCYTDAVSDDLFGTVRSFSRSELLTAWPKTFVAEGLSYARYFGASYAALDQQELNALEEGSRQVSVALGVADERILAALPRMALPAFERLNVETLVAVRESESSFADFRKFIRENSSWLVAGLEDPAFDREVKKFDKDHLAPAAKKLIAEVNGTKTLKDRLVDGKVDFLAGAVGGFALKGDVSEAFLAGTVGALAKAMFKILTNPNKPRGAAQAIYHLHTGHAHRFWSLT